MLDVHRLRDQFPDFNRYQARERALITDKLRVARAALRDCDGSWEMLQDRAASSDLGLVARLREAPAQAHTAPPRPTPITVVATDGSQIYPDRHVEPSCYLLNISRIAFQYGTLERPLMESVPRFRYRRAEMEDLYGALLENATAEVVSAVRDEYELAELLGTARAARLPQRPLVAMVDGTLIRWMLRGMRNHALEQTLIERYTRLLDDFQREAIALCSYISMPGGTEVINLLRVHHGETADTPPDSADSLAGLTDRWLFEQTLRPGERSALFESASRIQRAYGESRICFFYLGIPAASGLAEVGRVEVPQWLAADPALVDLVHAVVLSECEKGGGYPMILSEAHERAVIRAHEKALFYEMLEREMAGAGLPYSGSRKAASKRRPMV